MKSINAHQIISVSLSSKPKKHEEFIHTVPPSVILCILQGGCYLAGGALRSIYDRTPVADFDLFFNNLTAAEQATRFFEQSLIARKVFECPEGRLQTWRIGPHKIQLIKQRFYNSAEDLLISRFDFIPAMHAVYTDADQKLMYSTTPIAMLYARKKILAINKVESPYATMNRIKKYQKKGYNFSEDEAKKFFELVSNKNPEQLDWKQYID